MLVFLCQMLKKFVVNVVMKLTYNKNSKDPIYYIQQGVRNGRKTTARTIKRIGKHSELLAITDDPLAYAKKMVAEYNEKQKTEKVTMEVKVGFDEKVTNSGDTASPSTLRNIGYLFLQAVCHQLDLKKFFDQISADRRFTFDPNEVHRFLVFARILDPSSKFYACNHFNQFYEQPNIEYQHIMRTLTLMNDHFDEYIEYLYNASSNVIKRDCSVCYYDCTDFYFETESPDEDYVDEVTGEYLRGFRKYGFSKQHQPLPLVQMGLFMDAQGIPISMGLESGNTSEQTMAVPMKSKIARMFGNKEFIYVADAGLGSFNIRRFNDMGGRHFIVTQSLKKMAETKKEAVFNDCDYRRLSDNEKISLEFMKTFDKADRENKNLYDDTIYKVINADAIVDLGLTELKVFQNGNARQVKSKAEMKQSVIITFSRKAMEYQRFIRNRQIERAKDMLPGLDPELYKKGPNDVTRFITRKDKKKTKGKGEEIYCLNEDRIREEEKYDGFYAIATNMPCDTAEKVKKIIAISEGRNKIEECFRIMKTDFNGRPAYCQTKEHITAHFMTCYTALLIYRLLEVKLNQYGSTIAAGAEHYTTENILETLKNMNVVNIQDLYYTAAYKGSRTLNALCGIYDLGLDHRNYRPKDLNKKLKKIQ